MKHRFIRQEGEKVCEECGYVSGEELRQHCPMDLDKRENKK